MTHHMYNTQMSLFSTVSGQKQIKQHTEKYCCRQAQKQTFSK